MKQDQALCIYPATVGVWGHSLQGYDHAFHVSLSFSGLRAEVATALGDVGDDASTSSNTSL